ncbi:MAG: FAD-dependent oxidoreductase, partial [Gammaproteobacteria bacterium]
MHHVIIGAGPAGVVAAEALRKLDSDSQITLIGDEPEPPYSRMALPYYLIDQIKEKGTHLRKGKNHFQGSKIDVVQDRVTQLDPDNKTVTLKNGKAVTYDKLLIATGSHPVSPPIPGVDSPAVHPCWTLEDSRQ